jgi:hypothetical protein
MLDIGEYANDSRLMVHDESHASFYGHRCNPAVYVQPYDDGFHAYQTRSEFHNGKSMAVFLPTVTADAPTASAALRQIIGPVTPR